MTHRKIADEKARKNPENLSLALLRAQAIFLGDHPDVYVASTPLERRYTLKQFAKTMCKRMTRDGTPTAEAKAKTREHMKGFPRTEEDLKKWEEEKPKRVKAALKKADEPRKQGKPRPPPLFELEDDFEDHDPIAPSFEMQDGVKVYPTHGTFPPTGMSKRDGVTVSPIEELERPPGYMGGDLVGDQAPKTLTDLYARWPIATEDSQYRFRLERTRPKRHQGLDLAGYLGEIVGRAFSESEISKTYGGGEYRITLYGPDPRGKTDDRGEVIVKALTNPITVVIPGFPNPVLPTGEPMQMNPMNPFGAVMTAPTTPGEAAVHKTTVGFFADVMKNNQQEAIRREADNVKMSSQLLSYVTDSQKQQNEIMQREALRREELLREQLKQSQEDKERLKAKQAKEIEDVAKTEKAQSTAFVEFMKTLGPDKEAEVRRLQDFYNQRLEAMTRDHQGQLAAMRDRHEGDIRRADERHKDTESQYQRLLEQERTSSKASLEAERLSSRTTLENERSQWAQREKNLIEQVDKQVSAERNMAQQRIDDLKQRHESEVKQMERSHDRELRMAKESFDTKYEVASQTSKMTERSLQERYDEAKADVERIREEMEEATDLTKQLEKAEKQASLLGYEKKDADAPKGAMERFASTAGAGLSQLLATASDWVPGALAAARAPNPQQQQLQAQRSQQLAQHRQQQQLQAAQAQARARQAQQSQQQEAPGGTPQARRTRSAQWASEGVRVPVQEPTLPATPLGFSEDPAARPPQWIDTTPAPVVPQAPQSQPATAEVAQQSAEAGAEQNGNSKRSLLPEKFTAMFPEEAILGLITQVELQIDRHVEPAGFASLVVAQFGEGARALIDNFQASEIVDLVQGLEGGESSPIVRREGRKWLESFWREMRTELKQRASNLETLQTA